MKTNQKSEIGKRESLSMNTSGRQCGFLFYDFKLAEDFRGRSNKCNIVYVEIKERDLRGCHSSTGIGDGMGWTWYGVLHPSLVLHKVTRRFCFSSFCAPVSSCIETMSRMENYARLLCSTNHILHRFTIFVR